jgi:hypothetical protein
MAGSAQPVIGGSDRPTIDMEYVRTLLLELLEIPSPTGYTDQIVHRVGG